MHTARRHAGFWLAPILIGASLLLCGCATRAKTYSAPDASKVTAATKRLAAAIDKSSETVGRVEAKVKAAQESFDRVAASSASVLIQVHDLEQLVPAELKPRVATLGASIDGQIGEQQNLSSNLSGAHADLAQLRKDVAELVAAKEQLQTAQSKYQLDAALTARDATADSAAKASEIDRLKKQITSQKILKWLWRIGGVFVVLGIVALIGLWIAGKISIKGVRAYFRI